MAVRADDRAELNPGGSFQTGDGGDDEAVEKLLQSVFRLGVAGREQSVSASRATEGD